MFWKYSEHNSHVDTSSADMTYEKWIKNSRCGTMISWLLISSCQAVTLHQSGSAECIQWLVAKANTIFYTSANGTTNSNLIIIFLRKLLKNAWLFIITDRFSQLKECFKQVSWVQPTSHTMHTSQSHSVAASNSQYSDRNRLVLCDTWN